MIDSDDTIAAIATPYGEGGIAIIRVSGLKAFQVIRKIFVSSRGEAFLPVEIKKKTVYGYIVDPSSGQRIDEVIVLIMAAPHSYTCEDVVEIHCHGGVFLVRTVLSLVMNYGARPAGPGEFTMRAFLNGRIDLAQAEAVSDLISAESESALKAASSQLEGTLSSALSEISDLLIEVFAFVEVSIDFPEEDIEPASLQMMISSLESAKEKIDCLLKSFFEGRIWREGVSVVIIGRPNVGKSTLLNSLLMEDRAIVTPYPGTTRDIIEESITIGGIQCRIKDTAGLRTTTHEVEEEGIKRAKQAAKNADIIFFVLDWNERLTEEDISNFHQIAHDHIIVIANKSDKERKIDRDEVKRIFKVDEIVELSAKKNIGLDILKEHLKKRLSFSKKTDYGAPAVTRLRHQQLLLKAYDGLVTTLHSIDQHISPEFIALDMQSSLSCIEEITGKNISEDILDKIFNDFCIGK